MPAVPVPRTPRQRPRILNDRGRAQARVERVAVRNRCGALAELAWRDEKSSETNASAMIDPTSTKSSSCKPRVASAGVPIRSPLDTAGGRGSNGTALRFTVIPTL